MNLDTQTLRMIWNFVENANPYTLLNLSNQEIVQTLIKHIASVSSVDSDYNNHLSNYIDSRIMLIKDLAYSKVN